MKYLVVVTIITVAAMQTAQAGPYDGPSYIYI